MLNQISQKVLLFLICFLFLFLLSEFIHRIRPMSLAEVFLPELVDIDCIRLKYHPLKRFVQEIQLLYFALFYFYFIAEDFLL